MPRETRGDIYCSFFVLWQPLSRPLADSSPSRGVKNLRPWVTDQRTEIFYASLFSEFAEQHNDTGCRERDDEVQHRNDSALREHELPRLDIRHTLHALDNPKLAAAYPQPVNDDAVKPVRNNEEDAGLDIRRPEIVTPFQTEMITISTANMTAQNGSMKRFPFFITASLSARPRLSASSIYSLG